MFVTGLALAWLLIRIIPFVSLLQFVWIWEVVTVKLLTFTSIVSVKVKMVPLQSVSNNLATYFVGSSVGVTVT